MHVAGTGGFAKRGTNAARKLREKRSLADDIVGPFRIPGSNRRIEFGNEISEGATRTMAERDSTGVAAFRLIDDLNRGELALDFVVVLDTLFNRAVDVCDSVNLLHYALPFFANAFL
jgi:hypothetical protein